MTLSTLTTFSARIDHDVLSVSRLVDDQLCTIALIELASPIALIQQGETVRCRIQDGPDHLISVPQGTDPAQLLTQIAVALSQYKKRKKRIQLLGIFNVVVILCLMAGSGVAAYLQYQHDQENLSALLSHAQPQLSQSLAATAPGRSATPTASETAPTQVASAADLADADGWPLPISMRGDLAGKLQNAAGTHVFTVDYSTGHDRTLYVFADPQCPNCQRLEPVLNKIAGTYNVVVFPVAVIGQQKSIASITPVLCLPPEQRKAAWDALFDQVDDVMSLGKPVQAESATPGAADPAKCDFASKALGVNEVAYQTYRIPGTPWVISDDGRHVPQAVLQDPAKLQSFMSAAEVTHGAR